MARTSPLFFLPNTSTLLARTAIDLLKGSNQATLDEAIQTLINRSLPAAAVMPHLEQSVNFNEVLEKLSAGWTDETVRAFATALNMDPAKKDVMDLIVAIAILNEADLESELRAENTPQATINALLENRKIIWQYPPPGEVLSPPYVVVVAVEAVDSVQADSQVQAILGELVDYKGYKIARRTSTPFIRPDLIIRPDLKEVRPFARADELLKASVLADALQPAVTAPVGTAPSSPVAETTTPVTEVAKQPAFALDQAQLSSMLSNFSRVTGGM